MGLGSFRLGTTIYHLRRVSALPEPPFEKIGGTLIKRLIYSLAGVALLGLAGVFIYQAMAGSLVYFIVPSEYAAAPERYAGRIRLGGIVEARSIKYDDEALELGFNVTDGIQAYPVRYSGAPPELFKADTGVVVVGNFEQGTFVSNEVLIKHSSEYRPAKGEVDIEDLKNALE